jgi:hypothetical protein
MKRLALLFVPFVFLAAAAKSDPGTPQPNMPATYTFTCEYIYSDLRGNISTRQLVRGTYTESGAHVATWTNVSISNATGTADFGSPTEQTYMDGLSYDPADSRRLFDPDFFKAFPPNASQAQNLIWDTLMFEKFAEQTIALAPGKEIDLPQDKVDLAGGGNFQNTNIVLTNLGSGPWNGHDCTLIDYTAFFNPLNMQAPGMSLVGRSHYWGEIWMDPVTKIIEHGTLYEDVLGQLTLGNASQPQIISVLRKGTFTRQ